MYKSQYFTCRRLRMVEWLRSKGFLPFTTIPDIKNPVYSVWLYDRTPELEAAVTEYFEYFEREVRPILNK